MATPAQILANRANAQKSTGPQTPEGKAKSSMNRLSHGFASSTSVLPTEDRQEFMALMADLIGEYQPATPTEQILVEKMVQNQWLTRRALNLQGEAFLQIALGGETGVPRDLGLLIRYHTSAERAFHRAHNELVKTQKERKKSEIGSVPQNAAQPPAEPPEWPPEPAKMNFQLIPEAIEFIKKTA